VTGSRAISLAAAGFIVMIVPTNCLPACEVACIRIYVVDLNRLACTGGTSVVHLARYIIEPPVEFTSAFKGL